MNFVTRALSSVTEFYKDLNPATLSGAIDVIVVEQPNGELSCTPFHVRFGKLRLLRPQDKVVEVRVNGELTDFQMKLGDQGEAFFVVASDMPVPAEYTTSPIARPMTMDDEPDFLDLEADGGYRFDEPHGEQGYEYDDDDDQDGYVSAHSAQESDLETIMSPLNTAVMTTFTTKPSGLFVGGTKETELRINLPSNIEDTASDSLINDPTITEPLTLDSNKNDHLTIDVDAKSTTPDPHLHTTDGEIILDTKGYHNKEEKKREWPMPHQNPRHAFTMYEPYRSPRVLEQGGEFDRQLRERRQSNSTGITQQSDVFDEVAAEKSAQSHFRPLPNVNLKGGDTNDRLREPTSDTEVELHELQNHKMMPPFQRSTSPLSDTEIEYHDRGIESEDQWRWSWGQLPEKTGNDEWADEPTEYSSKTVTRTPHSFTVDGVQHTFELSLCGLGELNEDELNNERLFNHHAIDYDTFREHPTLLYDHRMVVRYNERYYSWMTAAPVIMSLLVFQRALPEETITAFANSKLLPPTFYEQDQEQQQQQRKQPQEGSGGWRTWWSRTTSPPPAASSSTVFQDDNNTRMAHPMPSRRIQRRHPMSYAKTLRLTSEQLTQLNLKSGSNTIAFKVATGNAECSAKIFFWKHNIKLIVSDIDGTITKSDALGHLFTMVGKDWTHPGVAKLYTDIVRNGYRIMYLTSRAIGQADSTRDYLRSVEQGQYQLPDGPVVMSPDRLFTSFHREVILRKPEVFKMACLRDIKRLFNDENPFYSGFGNRITDALSYRSVDVPTSRIFTIDYNGDVRRELLPGFRSSYVSLNDIVDQIFPPVTTKLEDEYNDYNFWKTPLPDIEVPSVKPPASAPAVLNKPPGSTSSAAAVIGNKEEPVTNLDDKPVSLPATTTNTANSTANPTPKRSSSSSRLSVIGSLVRMRSRKQVREEEKTGPIANTTTSSHEHDEHKPLSDAVATTANAIQHQLNEQLLPNHLPNDYTYHNINDNQQQLTAPSWSDTDDAAAVGGDAANDADDDDEENKENSYSNYGVGKSRRLGRLFKRSSHKSEPKVVDSNKEIATSNDEPSANTHKDGEEGDIEEEEEEEEEADDDNVPANIDLSAFPY
ncbi:Lipin/Ned1/Smp2-domain-containing protein [Syncephalis fuscata]|nr:Lipin/Ned1/Smp2-domain-containing protein [Syncephalis fuscata]